VFLMKAYEGISDLRDQSTEVLKDTMLIYSERIEFLVSESHHIDIRSIYLSEVLM
jgi:hypothetical protein